jgi:2-C-methyl-D-erythritol 4-phosphate cytidylyltransferase
MWKGKRVGVIIPAAGAGRRMGGGRSKPFIRIASQQILLRSLLPFERAAAVDAVVVVAAKRYCPEAKKLVARNKLRKTVGVVEGGKERQDSVWNGLQALANERIDIVLIHDAARPFVDARLIRRVVDAASTHGAAIPGIPLIDTVKSAGKDEFVGSTIDRAKLRRIQTPQGFSFERLMAVFREAMKNREYGTDEAMLFERRGIPVKIVEGSAENIKITTPGDLHLADYYARRRSGHGRRGL